MSKNTNKISRIAVLAVFIGIFAVFYFSYAIASSITANNIIKLVNDARSKEGLKTLQENPKLSAAASAKAEDMLKNDYFAHNSPAGKTPWYWIEKTGYNYKYAGENLAMNFTGAEEEQKAWMKSESHRKNILNSNYQEIGVAVAEGKIDGASTIVAVQMFGSSPSFVPAAEKVPTENLTENKAAVLGDENKFSVPAENQAAFPEDILVDNFIPEKTIEKTASPSASGSLWVSLKEKLSPAERPGWAVPLALNTLWMILGGNLLFLAYSFRNKVKVAGEKREKNPEEQKIPVENMEDEEEVSVAVKIHILHTAE
ncbi:MAG TPA: CAP domain-containing protein [Patescibacteria group bacterium]